MKLLSLLFVALAYGSPARTTTDLSHVTWQKLNEDDGIHLYQWSDPDSELFAFKAEGVVDAPVAKVASVLIDISRRKEWVHNLSEAHIVRWLTPHDRVEYVKVETPFVIKNRDFVIQGHAEFDKVKRAMHFDFHSIVDPATPETDAIRGVIHDSSYILSETADKKGTFISHRMHVDPKGSVAKWIVNIFQKGFPRKTFEGIRRQVLKPDIADHAEVKKWFEGG